jgi:hypothetical protein
MPEPELEVFGAALEARSFKLKDKMDQCVEREMFGGKY